MDFLIGSITSLLLLAVFCFFEKKRVAKLGITAILFFFYVVLCSFFLQPSDEFGIWLIFSLILYSVLDDMKTKTLHIYFPIIATLLFFFFLEKPYWFLFCFFFFFSFLFFIKATKEKIMGEGDSYLFLPLSVLLLLNLPGEHVSFMAMAWVSALLLSVLFASVVAIPLKLIKKDTESLAFGPFLVLGSSIIYNQPHWLPNLFSALFFFVLLCYVLWGIQFIGRPIVSYFVRLYEKKDANK